MKRAPLAALLLLTSWTSAVLANDSYSYECRNGSDLRTIEVVYLQRESVVPCEVNYIKNGQSKTLWNARYDKGYCEDEAEKFVVKQKGWGWDCKRFDAVESKPVEQQKPAEDDTKSKAGNKSVN